MPESLTFAACAAGFELRRADEVVGRVGPATGPAARAEAGGSVWELAVEGDRDVPAATWQVVAREGGEAVATYYHGSMRGGRVRGPADRRGSLRRELGVSAEWRFRLPDAAIAIRPFSDPAGTGLDLAFVVGSAEVPRLLVLLVCWCVMSEETIGPVRSAG